MALQGKGLQAMWDAGTGLASRAGRRRGCCVPRVEASLQRTVALALACRSGAALCTSNAAFRRARGCCGCRRLLPQGG